MSRRLPRRGFLRALPGAAVALLGVAARPLSAGRRTEHPEPRPGIDASGVLGPDDLPGFGPDVLEVYDQVREMPEIADGIGCSCGCVFMPGYRSLLTCFHAGGMAMGCQICQGTARLAHRRWKRGQSLDRIRAALDARFG
jgi:hypothetical protein